MYGYDDYPSSGDSDRAYFDGEGQAFRDPGGRSALRRASRRNPRCFPCPTCKQPNKLTRQDVARHYQCDACADRDEGLGF